MIIGDILVYYTNIFAYLIRFGVIADTAFSFFLPSGAGIEPSRVGCSIGILTTKCRGGIRQTDVQIATQKCKKRGKARHCNSPTLNF